MPPPRGGKGVVGCAWIAAAAVLCLFVALAGLCSGAGPSGDTAISIYLGLLGIGGILAALAVLVGLILLLKALFGSR